MRRIPAWGLVVAGTLVAAACGGPEGGGAVAGGGAGPGGGGRGPGGPGGGGVPPAAVEVEPAVRGSIARAVTVSGVIEPLRTVAVNAQLGGQLRAVLVEEGDRVRRGQPLARLDDRELQAQLASAQATFDVAEASYRRAEQLIERQVITLPEYEAQRTAFAAARAQLEQLRTRLDFAVVEAPVDGLVTVKRVEAGDAVGVQTPLFSVAEVATLVVRVGVSELDVVEIAVDDPAEVVLDALPGRTFRGRVRRIFPVADPSTRLVPVEVALEDGSVDLTRPGFLARVTFALDAHDDVVLVPGSAIVRGAGSDAVFVVEEGAARRQTVTTGLTSQGRVEIVEGLQGGETVVVTGGNTLRDGAPVRIVAGAPGASSATAGADPSAGPSADAAETSEPAPRPEETDRG